MSCCVCQGFIASKILLKSITFEITKGLEEMEIVLKVDIYFFKISIFFSDDGVVLAKIKAKTQHETVKGPENMDWKLQQM